MNKLLAFAAVAAGVDGWSPVTDAYDPWNNAFTGTINKVTVKHKDKE